MKSSEFNNLMNDPAREKLQDAIWEAKIEEGELLNDIEWYKSYIH